MTGTGTENDPFLVDNWADFRQIDTSSKGIYVKWADSENKVIDFNDIQPEGFSETVKIPINVDFNGWTLRNFTSMAANTAFQGFGSSTHSNVSNLVLENFYMAKGGSLSSCNFKSCIFSGIIYADSSNACFSYSNLTGCSANIQISCGSDEKLFSGCDKCENSDIIIDISAKTCAVTSNSYIYNSRISGKIQCSSTGNIPLSIRLSSVFNLESNLPLYCTTASGISVFNSEIAQKTENSSANLTGVTAEQLKNAEYLYNLGFPIGVD